MAPNRRLTDLGGGCDLHDDEVYEVNGRRLVQLLGVVVRVDRVGDFSEGKPDS